MSVIAASCSTAWAQNSGIEINNSVALKNLGGELFSNLTTPKLSKLYSPMMAKAPSTREELRAMYAYPQGAYFWGLNNKGQSNSNFILFGGAGYNAPWEFENRSTEGATYTWYMQDQQATTGVDAEGNFSFITVPAAQYPMPKLVVSSEGSKTATYQFGTEVDKSGVVPQATMLVSAYVEESMSFTEGDIHYGGYYGNYQDSEDPYAFGCGIVREGEKSTGVAAFFEKPMIPVYVERMSTTILTDASVPMPADGTIKIELRKVGENREITSEVIATGSGKASDLEAIGDEGMYYLPFYFTEIDPETGAEIQYNPTIKDAFVAFITGLDQPGFDFGFTFCQAMSPITHPGNFYNMFGDKLVPADEYQIEDGENINACNSFLAMEGIMNCLEMFEGCEYVVAPKEGGEVYFQYPLNPKEGEETQTYNFIQIMSSYSLEDKSGDATVWFDDVPSWLSITPNEDLWEEDRSLRFYVEAEPLPSDMESRQATLTFRSFGVEATSTVLQGIIAEGITNTEVSAVKAMRNGENFDLTYPAGITSVTVLNAAGQTVATYELPQEGQFTLPAANLVKGLYILNFNGERTAGVKIMK